jgi:hypothetical protein
MSKLSILFEVWQLIKTRKKWILLPIITFLILLGALITYAQGSAVAPFLYTLF